MPITIPQGLEVAGTLVNNLRDVMPDPVYSGTTPQPDNDGSRIRARTLYAWLTEGIRDMARRMGYEHEDWWAVPIAAYQNTYALDARWRRVTDVFVNQYWCSPANETRTIWPAASATTGSQSVTFDQHKMTGQLDLYLYPAPGNSDPVTTLVGNITATDTVINVASSVSFLSFGYLQIGNEMIQYQRLAVNQVSVCRRGVAGTTAAAHNNGDTVRHCALWLKGVRSPNPVVASTDPVELPYDALDGLVEYALAQYARFEQDTAMAQMHRQNYLEACESIKRDPRSQQVPGAAQVRPYGGYGGGIAWHDGWDGVIVR